MVNSKLKVILFAIIGMAVVVIIASGIALLFFTSPATQETEQASQSEASTEQQKLTPTEEGNTAIKFETSPSMNSQQDEENNEATETLPTTPEEHTHTWIEETETIEVAEVTHTEQQTVPGADIVEYKIRCDACGATFANTDELATHYLSNPTHPSAGYTTNYPVVVGQEPSTTQTITVIDTPAHTEIVTKKVCSVCGIEETG